MKNSIIGDHLRRPVNYYPYAVAGILGLALGLRMIGLSKGIWLDEQASLRVIAPANVIGMLSAVKNDGQMPLYFAVLKLWSQIGTSEEFLRLPSIFFGFGSVVAVIAWLKPYSLGAGLLGGLYLATAPMMLRYSQEIRDYALLLLATLLSYFFTSRVIARPEKIRNYVGLSLCLCAVVATHLTGASVILPICVFIAVHAHATELHWKQLIAAITLPCALFSVIYLVYSRHLGIIENNWWMPPVSSELLLSTILYDLGISRVALHIPPTTDVLLNAANYLSRVFFLTVIGILVMLGDWRKNFPFFLAAVVYGLEIIFYSVVRTPIFWYTTFLPAIIPLAGFVALQIATIKESRIRSALVLGFGTACLFFAARWIVNDAWMPVEEWRKISNVIRSNWKPDALAILYPGYIEGPIKYYVADLSTDAILSIPPGASRAQIEANLKNKFALEDRHVEPSTVFLVVRPDTLLQRNQGTFSELLSALDDRIGKRIDLQFILITPMADVAIDSALFDYRQKMLDDLRSEFGEATFFKDAGSIVLAEYDGWQRR